jgi:RNA polymerase sigma-70 factor (ECF subfamily)
VLNNGGILNACFKQMNMMFWYGIDLRWAYADLLPSIYRQTTCKHSAYDILHDALVRFALSNNASRQENPHAYLRTITQHLVVDGFKQRSRFVSVFDANSNHTETNNGIEDLQNLDSIPSAEHLLDIKQRLQIVQSIMDKFPAKCKQVFWLYRIESMPQDEIATVMNISKNMVQRHMMRAMLDFMEARDLIS